MNAFAPEIRIAPDQIARARSLFGFPIPIWLPAIIAAVAAILIQSLWIPIDADVSWLITVSERVISGDRLYVDILEVNPPASVWMYLPLVWIAQLLGARPEAVVAGAFVGGGLLSVFATSRLVAKLDDPPAPAVLTAALSLIALVLPMALFAQREHAALLLALPSMAALAVIAEGKPLSRSAVFASGLAAGLIVIIKPHFALAVAAPACWAAWKRRSISPLLPGAVAATSAVALYGGAILLFGRAYLHWLPVIVHTYGHLHEVFWKLAVGPALFPAICLGLAFLMRAPRAPALAISWGLGAAGFLVAAWLQGKNYPNHWLPEAALALIAVFVMLSMPKVASGRRAAVGFALLFVAFCEMTHWVIVPDPAVAAAIERVAPPRPRIMALSTQLTTGHPVVRNVDGEWVASRAGLFTAAGARYVGFQDPIARRSYREDIDSFAREVATRTPDVVLVDRQAKDWLMAEPAIGNVMRGYRFADRVGDTEIWIRLAATR
jgi:hypothetical protein